jgi:hypothetical protein
VFGGGGSTLFGLDASTCVTSCHDVTSWHASSAAAAADDRGSAEAAANPGASSNLWELKSIANHQYGKYICSIIELSALLIEFLKRSTKDVSMPHEVQILTMQFRLR